MERFVRLVVARPGAVIATIAVVTALFVFELRHLRLDVNLRDEMPDDHPYMEVDARLRDRLGAEQTSLLAIGAKVGDVFTPAMLARLQRLTAGVARLPGVLPTSVASLASPQTKVIESGADGVDVAPLLTTVPQDAAGLRRLRETVFSYPMFVGNLITPDGRGALVLADFDERVSAEEITSGLEALAEGERDAETEILVGGQSPALAALQTTTRGVVPFVLVAVGVIALVHYEAFRTAQAALLPLATAGLSVVWAMGLMALLGFRITPWTALTAILVLSAAAGHAVQILKRYYECLHELGDSRAAIVRSVLRIGPVMVTAGLVAAAGLASLATLGVPAVRDFGLMATFGILSALVVELTFIPAVRALLPAPRSSEATREREHRLLDRVLETIADAVCRRPRLVVGVVIAGVGLAALGIPRLRVNSSFRSWFGVDAPVIVADRAIRERFTGTSTIRVLVEADAAEGLLEPSAMRGIEALQQTFAAEPDVTATLSIADYVKALHRGMHDGTANAYRIPDSRNLIAQYLLLYGPSDLARVVTSDYRTAAVYALARSDRVAWVDGVFERLRQVAADTLPAGVHAHVAGGELAQASAMNATVVREKLLNMLQVGTVIFILAALVFRSAVAGLLVLAPLACAAAVNLGLMGWFGSWLSFATASCTAVGVSLGADFAIYSLFRLREEMGTRPLPDAIRETLRTSGKAIFFVASAIAVGYATLAASSFALWRQLGVYVALMMAISALTTVTLLPALVLLGNPEFLRRGRGTTRGTRAAA